MPDAFLFRSILDSAAIESYLVDENLIRVDWLWCDLLGRIKPCVRNADAEAALNLLEQDVMEKFPSGD